MYTTETIQGLYTEAATLNEQFKSLDRDWAAKGPDAEGYADAATQMDRLIAASQAKLTQARRYEAANAAERELTAPDPAKALPTPGADADEDGRSDAVKAFDDYLRWGRETPAETRKHLKRWDDRGPSGRKAALNETTAGQGGYLVPVEYSADFVRDLTYGSIFRQPSTGATIRPLRSASMKIPVVTDSGRAVKTGEAQAYDEDEPQFSEIEIKPFKYTRLVKASEEVLEDAEVNLYTDIIAPDITNAFALAENEDFTSGTGGSPQTDPEGIVTGASTGVTTASPTAFTVDEVIDLFTSVSPLHRAMAKWMLNDAIAVVLRKMKYTGGNEDYIWVPGLRDGIPDQLLGRPVVFNPNMDSTQTADSTIMIFGNLKYFHIFDRSGGQAGGAGVAIRQLNELYATTGQVGWIARKRYTSKVMLAAAIKKMVMHS